jgi:ribokinase
VKRIAVVGSINTDLVVRVAKFPSPGETVLGYSFNTYAGGKGANQAAAAARLGGKVTMIGAIGDDAYGPERLADLRDAGVDVARVLVRDQTPGGIAVIQVEDSGQNQIVLVPGANGTVTPEDAQTGLAVSLSPGDILCGQLELPLETVRASLEIAKANGATTVINTAPIIEGSRDLLGLIDVLVVNEIEAGQLLGREPVRVDEACDAAAALADKGPEVVFVTLGGSGAVILDSGMCISIPAPEVEVVDTTGAGDACVGAFVAALADEKRTEESARFAVAAGSFAVQRAGAQPSQPTRNELDQFMDQHGIGNPSSAER